MERSVRLLRGAVVALLLLGASAAIFAAGIFLINAAGIQPPGWGYMLATWSTVLLGLLPLAAGVYLVLRRLHVKQAWFRRMAITALPLFVAAALLHNVVAALTGLEEPVFFIFAVLAAPLLLLVGFTGIMWPHMYNGWMRYRARRHGSGSAPSPS